MTNFDNSKLSNRVRLIRKSYYLTQEDLGEKLGISASAYGKIERNPICSSMRTLKKIAEAIGISFNFLLDIENPKFIE